MTRPIFTTLFLAPLAFLAMGFAEAAPRKESRQSAPPHPSAARISFLHDVHPILSKAGCNQGTCHGNANGKGGLKLSLRGGSPEQDFYNLVGEAFGRRINRAQPERSLLLRKPTAAVAHEGGQRFRPDAREYRVIRQWIREGGQSDLATAPALTRLEVTPAARVIQAPVTRQQLSVRAYFGDGRTRDVTSEAVYESSDPSVTVSGDGLVQAPSSGAEAGILVRWADGMEAAHLIFVPDRPAFTAGAFEVRNLVDEAVLAKLRTLRLPPSAQADDTVFLRRAYLDALGVPPTAAETRAFLRDATPDKRGRLIDALLERPGFADFWALRWADLLRAEERTLDPVGMKALYGWLQQGFRDGKPLDRFARELLTSSGSTYVNPAANYYRRTREPQELAEVTAQLFMGVRLQCAKCHNHPYDVWKQDQYHETAAFFARLTRNDKRKPRRQKGDYYEMNGEEFIFIAKSGEVKHPRTGEPVSPALPGDPAATRRVAEADDRRTVFADWLVDPANPYFAPTMVNRIWYHLMGRGIVDPVDDFRPSNPPSNGPLLDALTRDFVAHGFDLRRTVAMIMKSSTYQLSDEPNALNEGDTRYFSHSRPRRMTAEQILDAFSVATGSPTKFEGYPKGTPVVHVVPTWKVNPFLQVFGQPPRETVCECERSDETTLGQSFELIGGEVVDEKLTDPDNAIGRLLAEHRADGEIVVELYLAALSRYPTIGELRAARAHIAEKGDRRGALEDVLWAVLNTTEFMMRR